MPHDPVVSPHDQSATFVELFFDLVFVFSVTQVVGLLHEGIDWMPVVQALLVFWLVWWAWTQFTWALNAANTDHPRVQLGTLVATGVAFFMAIAVPDAFRGGALRFALPYVLVRALGLLLYAWVASRDPRQHAAVRTFGFVSLGGLVAVLLGALAGGEQQIWFWAFAIFLDVVAAGVGGQQEGWDLHPLHFVERHGLIVIIALGESLIVAAGGLSGVTPSGPLVAVAVLAVALTCGFWWSYFPYVKPELERGLESTTGAAQSSMARDAFSLYHFPMLCGIVAFAAAVEEAVAHPAEPSPPEVRAAMAIGLVLFLAATGLAVRRTTGRWLLARFGIAAGTGVAVHFAGAVSPAAGLAVALAGVTAVIGVEHRSLTPSPPRGTAGLSGRAAPPS